MHFIAGAGGIRPPNDENKIRRRRQLYAVAGPP